MELYFIKHITPDIFAFIDTVNIRTLIKTPTLIPYLLTLVRVSMELNFIAIPTPDILYLFDTVNISALIA